MNYTATLNGTEIVTKPTWHEVAHVLVLNGFAFFAHKVLFTLMPGVKIRVV